jgi:hypothetical protein
MGCAIAVGNVGDVVALTWINLTGIIVGASAGGFWLISFPADFELNDTAAQLPSVAIAATTHSRTAIFASERPLLIAIGGGGTVSGLSESWRRSANIARSPTNIGSTSSSSSGLVGGHSTGGDVLRAQGAAYINAVSRSLGR